MSTNGPNNGQTRAPRLAARPFAGRPSAATNESIPSHTVNPAKPFASAPHALTSGQSHRDHAGDPQESVLEMSAEQGGNELTTVAESLPGVESTGTSQPGESVENADRVDDGSQVFAGIDVAPEMPDPDFDRVYTGDEIDRAFGPQDAQGPSIEDVFGSLHALGFDAEASEEGSSNADSDLDLVRDTLDDAFSEIRLTDAERGPDLEPFPDLEIALPNETLDYGADMPADDVAPADPVPGNLAQDAFRPLTDPDPWPQASASGTPASDPSPHEALDFPSEPADDTPHSATPTEADALHQTASLTWEDVADDEEPTLELPIDGTAGHGVAEQSLPVANAEAEPTVVLHVDESDVHEDPAGLSQGTGAEPTVVMPVYSAPVEPEIHAMESGEESPGAEVSAASSASTGSASDESAANRADGESMNEVPGAQSEEDVDEAATAFWNSGPWLDEIWSADPWRADGEGAERPQDAAHEPETASEETVVQPLAFDGGAPNAGQMENATAAGDDEAGSPSAVAEPVQLAGGSDAESAPPAASVAELMEAVAQRVREGKIVVTGESYSSEAAALAAVLSALLAGKT